jgi:GTP pyrophosphokinase
MGVCSEFKTSASSVTARVKRDKTALISLTLQINNLDHLHRVMERLRTLRDVRNVYRVTKREARASG